MIKIDGITTRQTELLEIMWNIPTTEDLAQWLTTLDERDARDADTLSQVLIYEYIDLQIDQNPDFSDAQEVLARYQY
jgi:hypothetical protein